MEPNKKIVEFWNYCGKCKHNGERDAWPSPCDECLEHGGRENSHKPVKFELDDTRHKRTL